jgi:hypothetical protein
MDISSLPIKIERLGERGEVYLKIGDKPAAILEPKNASIKGGVTYINTVDFINCRWDRLVKCDVYGENCRGFSNDPRLLEISQKVFQGSLSECDVGVVYPPLEAGTRDSPHKLK